jgi:hypothetical protein
MDSHVRVEAGPPELLEAVNGHPQGALQLLGRLAAGRVAVRLGRQAAQVADAPLHVPPLQLQRRLPRQQLLDRPRLVLRGRWVAGAVGADMQEASRRQRCLCGAGLPWHDCRMQHKQRFGVIDASTYRSYGSNRIVFSISSSQSDLKWSMGVRRRMRLVTCQVHSSRTCILCSLSSSWARSFSCRAFCLPSCSRASSARCLACASSFSASSRLALADATSCVRPSSDALHSIYEHHQKLLHISASVQASSRVAVCTQDTVVQQHAACCGFQSLTVRRICAAQRSAVQCSAVLWMCASRTL